MFGYDSLRALHVILMVGYFAGTFCTLWLIALHKEAERKFDPERATLLQLLMRMQRRTWLGIAWPCFLGLIGSGIWLFAQNPGLFTETWMHLKLGLVALLLVHHLITHRLYDRVRAHKLTWSGLYVRLWNSIAVLFLCAIVGVAMNHNDMGTVWGFVGAVFAALAILFLVKMFRKKTTVPPPDLRA